MSAGNVHAGADGIVLQLQSSALNGHGQLRPSRLELQDSAGERPQNGLPATLPAASVAVTSACKPASSKCNTVTTQSLSSASEVTVSAGSSKESKIAKVVADSGTGSGNPVTEVNGNPQSSLSSDAVVKVGVQLPSPPPTPPTAKLQLADSRPIVFPSPARGFKSERQDGRKNSTPDSIELPPPPSPPLQFCQSSSLDSPSGILPPPPLDDSLYAIPPRVSPPPPMSPVSSAAADFVISASETKTVTCSNEMSTFVVDPVMLVDGLTALSGGEAATQHGDETASNDQPLVRDTRCDLLAAIREGTLAVCAISITKPIITCCSVLPPEIVMHDAYIGGRFWWTKITR